jgi:antitoxin (DNA-binding transcriptional repressor) of toxin-antitoxin stability system
MLSIAIDELETQAPEIVRAVREQQIEYLITDQGVPVARLAPLTEEAEAVPKPTGQAKIPVTRQEVVAEIEQILAEGRDLLPKNRRALEIMREWLSEPDEHDEAWWDEFNAELAQNRFTFRRSV